MKGGEDLRTAPSIADQSYEGEKAQVLKQLRALLLTFSEKRKTPRDIIQKAITFIEQE